MKFSNSELQICIRPDLEKVLQQSYETKEIAYAIIAVSDSATGYDCKKHPYIRLCIENNDDKVSLYINLDDVQAKQLGQFLLSHFD
jgi:hypothetical protein